jgi:hypothetical protein
MPDKINKADLLHQNELVLKA